MYCRYAENYNIFCDCEILNMKNKSLLSFQELSWFVPFSLLGFILLSLLRPLPVLQIPPHNIIVTDADGIKVPIPSTLHGVVGWAPDFLAYTHAPNYFYKGGGLLGRKIFDGRIISHIYPEILNNNSIWDSPTNIESLMTYDQGIIVLGGIYFGGTRFNSNELRPFGITSLTTYFDLHNDDEEMFTRIRITNGVLGKNYYAQQLISNYKAELADLESELKPQTLKVKPIVMGMGSKADDWSRLFTSSLKETEKSRIGINTIPKEKMALGREQDAERILAMNPDIIILGLEDVQEFSHDPRWQGLRAVQNNRVYGNAIKIHGFNSDVDNIPFGARWLAELVHPDRLQPKLREMIQEYYQKAYGYHISDDELDDILHVDENKNTLGYQRFLKNHLQAVTQK